MDTIKSVEQNYKWIIYRLCCESYQNKYEIINTETADQNILDSDVANRNDQERRGELDSTMASKNNCKGERQ